MALLLSRIRRAGEHQLLLVLATLPVAIFVILAVLTSALTLQSQSRLWFFCSKGVFATYRTTWVSEKWNKCHRNQWTPLPSVRKHKQKCLRERNKQASLCPETAGPEESPFSVTGPFTSLAHVRGTQTKRDSCEEFISWPRKATWRRRRLWVTSLLLLDPEIPKNSSL